MAVDEAVEESTPEILARHDLTAKISRYLGPHLVLTVLEFIGEQNVREIHRATYTRAHANNTQIYNPRDIADEKLRLLKATHMWDHASNTFRAARPGEEVPPGSLMLY